MQPSSSDEAAVLFFLKEEKEKNGAHIGPTGAGALLGAGVTGLGWLLSVLL